MTTDAFDTPELHTQWCAEQRAHLVSYLRAENLEHGAIGEEPAWCVAPYVALWAIDSLAAPGQVGWWAISGDLPTDYVSSAGITHPREALRAFANSWAEVAVYMLRGEPHPTCRIGKPADWPELGDLLKRRAELFLEFADDDDVWTEETAKEYLLVLQFREDAVTWDDLVELGDALIESLGELAEVDGHDIGAGEANIFIFTDDVASTFDKTQQVLNEKGKSLSKAAWREVEGEEYKVLFPAGASEFSIA